jgi:transposase
VLSPLVKILAPELLAIPGISTVTAAGLIGHAGDMRNTRNSDAFAMRTATAPLQWSSGKTQSVRINTGGNRQLNRLLYIVALVQLRFRAYAGRIYFDRKCAEGKTPKAAMRPLKRQLSTIVYFRLRLCQERIEGRLFAQAA